MLQRSGQGTGHRAALYALTNSHRPSHILSGGGDGWVTEWPTHDLETGRVVAQVQERIFSLAISPAHWPKQLVLAGNMLGGLHWIDLAKPEEGSNILHHSKGIYAIVWVGEQVLTAGGDGTLTRWDAHRQRPIESIQLSNRSLRCIAYHAATNQLAVGASDGCIYYLNPADFELLAQVSAHQHSVFSLQWSTDGRALFSGGRDALLKAWQNQNINTMSLPAHMYTVNDLTLSPDGHYLASASRDKTIRIWRTKDLELVKALDTIRDQGHRNSVNKLLWREDGLYSCSDDTTVMVWR